MKNLILLALLTFTSSALAGCVVYPARTGYVEPYYSTVVYEGVQYYYDPAPAYVAGEVAVGLYIVDGHGRRHYRYVPQSRWHDHFPVRPHH